MKKWIVLLLTVLMISGCGAESEGTLKIVDGRVSEQKLVHHLIKMLVEDRTELKVDIGEEMTAVNAYNEMKKGVYDLYMSYDGTVLTTFLHRDPSEVPAGMTLFEYTNQIFLEEDGLMMVNQLGLDNTYAVAVPQQIKDQYQLQTISDLAPVASQLVFCAEHEFFGDEGTMKFEPFTAFYGLNFKSTRPVDLSLKYSTMESGNADVTVAYATDGRNKKVQLQILEDDRQFFPEYNGVIVVQDDLFEKYADLAPQLEDILHLLDNIFTNESMTDLSYQVDIEEKSVEEVARQFLVDQGLLD